VEFSYWLYNIKLQQTALDNVRQHTVWKLFEHNYISLHSWTNLLEDAHIHFFFFAAVFFPFFGLAFLRPRSMHHTNATILFLWHKRNKCKQNIFQIQILCPSLRINGHLPTPIINGGNSFWKWKDLQISRAHDLDLGSGHTA